MAHHDTAADEEYARRLQQEEYRASAGTYRNAPMPVSQGGQQPPQGTGGGVPLTAPVGRDPYAFHDPATIPVAEPVGYGVAVAPQEEFFVKAFEILRLAKIVRILAIIDIVFTALWAIMIWPLIFVAILPVVGYFGASQLRVGFLYIYIVYLCLHVIGSIILILVSTALGIVLNIISILITLYIIRIVYTLASHLSSLTLQELSDVRHANQTGELPGGQRFPGQQGGMVV